MKRRISIFVAVLICFLPLFILRDFTPANELRYLNIVEEQITTGHIFALFNNGIPYADKPPLYFWLASLLKLLFGGDYMFLLCMLSFIPALVIATVMDKWAGERLSPIQRVGALLMLLSTAYFMASFVVLRMDMLMCMFIVLSLYTFYKLYQNYNATEEEKGDSLKAIKYNGILLPIYVFLAIFSKGAVGFLLPVLTIIVFLISEHDWHFGRYIGWRFWGILAGLCALWFIGVYIDGGKDYLNNLLFHQTLGRAVNSFHHKKPLWYYFATYWYILFPWSVLIVTALLTGWKRRVLSGKVEKLFACAALTTFVMLSLVSSKVAVYLLPAIPFFIYIAAIVCAKSEKSGVLKISVAIPAVLLIILPITFTLLQRYLPSSATTSADAPIMQLPTLAYSLILATGGIVTLILLKKETITQAIIAMASSVFVLAFVAGLSTKTINREIGAKESCEIAISKAVAEDEEVYWYKFSSAPNLNYWFKQKGLTLKEITTEELDKMGENYIILFKERELRRDSTFKKCMGGIDYYKGGDNICVAEVITQQQQPS